jgi:TPR repeat protein
MAANRGDADAMERLGELYMNGFATDRGQAVEWFKEGAARGNQKCRDELRQMGGS